jgi:membrane protein YqaA with SNARE-associated domain
VAHLLALFGWSFAAATILPLSSEVSLAYLVNTHGQLWLAVAVATAGNYLGACSTYWLARGAVRAAESRRTPAPPSPRKRRAVVILRRWGAPALLLSWVPVLGDALVVAAGAARVSFPASSVFLILGKLARYLVVAWAALPR